VQIEIPVGLVGCGRWGRNILRDLLSLGCEVAVVARSESTRQVALQMGAGAVVKRICDLPEVFGLVVATPTSTHAQVVEEVLKREVPVFVEKPLTTDWQSCAALARAASNRLFVMDKWRYHPGVEALAQIARCQELGPVLGLRTFRVAWGNPHSDVDVVWILAPHDLAIALEILGEIPQPKAAAAEHDGQRASGLIGILGERPWFVFEVSERYQNWHREIRLHCRDGVAVLDDAYSNQIRILRGSSQAKTPQEELRPLPSEMPLWRELRAFVEHLKGGPPPRSSAQEGSIVVDRIAELRRLAGLKC